MLLSQAENNMVQGLSIILLRGLSIGP